MQEQNRETLIKAIKELPVHEPGPAVWDRITGELDLQESIQQLPQYAPPSAIWENIEAELDSAPAKQAKRITLYRKLSVAASVAILLVAGFWLLPKENASETVSYEIAMAEEVFKYENDWDGDESSLIVAVNAFKGDPVAQQDDNYNTLLAEWDELNEAKKEIKEMMDKYGHDSQFVRQLGAIERGRAAVAKQMAINI